MPTPVSPAAFTISDTKPDGLALFPFFFLLIDSLTMSLPVEQGTTVTVSA